MVDTVVIQSDNSQAPEGHEQKMIDLVDKNSQIPQDNLETPPAEDRPQWLPEKFKSAEDLAKAYAELESKLGGKTESQTPAETTPESAKQELDSKGLDLNEFSQEFASNGSLSQESYEKLAKAGYSKDIVDNYIAGQQARAQAFEAEIKTEIGGTERYNEMVEWAKANLTPGEIAAYNAAVSSGSPEQAKLAALGLSAKFSNAVGSEPKRTLGGTRGGVEDVFESTAQLTEAMRDPRYKNDPAYRAKVQAKLGRSNVF